MENRFRFLPIGIAQAFIKVQIQLKSFFGINEQKKVEIIDFPLFFFSVLVSKMQCKVSARSEFLNKESAANKERWEDYLIIVKGSKTKTTNWIPCLSKSRADNRNNRKRNENKNIKNAKLIKLSFGKRHENEAEKVSRLVRGRILKWTPIEENL